MSRSIDGLNTLECDIINIVSGIEINGDNGADGHLLSSTGTGTLWESLENIL